MRVLFIQQGLGYGGASQSLIQMQKCLKDDVEIFTILKKNRRLNQKLKHLLIHSKEVVEMDIPGVYNYSEGKSSQEDLDYAMEYDAQELIDFILDKQIDIVHVNASVFSNLYEDIKSKTKAKIVTHIREVIPQSDDTITRFIVKEIRQFSDWIIPIAEEEMYYFSDLPQCQMVINPVDTSVFCPRKAMTEQVAIRLGMVANFNPLKGHLLFLEVASILNQMNAGGQILQFEMLGLPKPGFLHYKAWLPLKRFAYYREVMSKYKSLQLQNVRLLPFRAEVQSVIQHWHIGLRLEKSMMPWGRDVLELMSSGVAVVAVGNSEVVIQNGTSGILVDSLDAQSIVAKIQELILDAEKRKSIATIARQWVEENASVPVYREQILSIYKKVLTA